LLERDEHRTTQPDLAKRQNAVVLYGRMKR
jgi:hypothetical protein